MWFCYTIFYILYTIILFLYKLYILLSMSLRYRDNPNPFLAFKGGLLRWPQAPISMEVELHVGSGLVSSSGRRAGWLSSGGSTQFRWGWVHSAWTGRWARLAWAGMDPHSSGGEAGRHMRGTGLLCSAQTGRRAKPARLPTRVKWTHPSPRWAWTLAIS